MRDITSILKDEEYIIPEWSQLFLRDDLKRWYWDKQDYVSAESYYDNTCKYLYFPRLCNEGVLQNAIAKGTDSEDFFGIAYGFENGKYIGFKFGEKDSLVSIKSLLLIDPIKAKAYKESLKPQEPKVDENSTAGGIDKHENHPQVTLPINETGNKETYRFFFGSVKLNQNMAENEMKDINQEVIRLLTDAGADVKISVEIEAKLKNGGFNTNTCRDVTENCKSLSFKTAQFEKGDEY